MRRKVTLFLEALLVNAIWFVIFGILALAGSVRVLVVGQLRGVYLGDAKYLFVGLIFFAGLYAIYVGVIEVVKNYRRLKGDQTR